MRRRTPYTTEQEAAFRAALTDALGTDPAEAIRAVARAVNYDPETVRRWRKAGDNIPGPSVVFKIEQALGLTPGSLSKHLGYYPPDATVRMSVPDAVAADPALDEHDRRTLLLMYDSFRSSSHRRRRGQ